MMTETLPAAGLEPGAEQAEQVGALELPPLSEGQEALMDLVAEANTRQAVLDAKRVRNKALKRLAPLAVKAGATVVAGAGEIVRGVAWVPEMGLKITAGVSGWISRNASRLTEKSGQVIAWMKEYNALDSMMQAQASAQRKEYTRARREGDTPKVVELDSGQRSRMPTLMKTLFRPLAAIGGELGIGAVRVVRAPIEVVHGTSSEAANQFHDVRDRLHKYAKAKWKDVAIEREDTNLAWSAGQQRVDTAVAAATVVAQPALERSADVTQSRLE